MRVHSQHSNKIDAISLSSHLIALSCIARSLMEEKNAPNHRATRTCTTKPALGLDTLRFFFTSLCVLA